MQRTRNEFFASARFAVDEYGGFRRRDAGDFFIKFEHRRCAPYHACWLGLRCCGFQFTRLGFALIERALHDGQHVFDLERLRDQIPRAFLRSLDSGFQRTEARNQNHRTSGAKLFEQIEARLRGFEMNVADDQIESAACKQ